MYKEKRKLGIVLLSIFVAIFVISLTMIGANKALAIDEDDGDDAEITPEQFYDMDDTDEPNLDGSNSNGTPKPIWVIGHRANNRGNVSKALSQGANGVEIDIRRKDGDQSRGIVNHDAYRPNLSMSLEEYFASEIRDQKKRYDASVKNKVKDGFCVLFLDIKTPDKDLPDLQRQVRGGMQEYQMEFYVVYQVETYDQAMMPGGLCQCWCNHGEGVCVSGDYAENGKKGNDGCAEKKENGMTHCWFGNGFGGEPLWWTVKARQINNSLKEGKKGRDDKNGAIQKIGTWSLNTERAVKNSFIKYDCDGALCEFGGGDVAPNGTRGVRNAQAVLKKYSNKIRLANLNDYPFWNSGKTPLPKK